MNPSIDHVAIVVRDLDEALDFYRGALGVELAHRREVPEEGVEVASLSLGEATIELIRPLDEKSGVSRFLEKRGEGLHHVCLTVADIEAATRRLVDAGAELLGEGPQVGAAGTRYVFIHPRSAHGVLLELYEARDE